MIKIDLHSYDKYIVSFSGGKDSTACFLYLLDNNIPIDKIELWHQDIDGKEDSFMDWPITTGYCIAFAKAFNVKLYFQWKQGGFKREMLRHNQRTAPTSYEQQDSTIKTTGGNAGKFSTRRKFPQLSADLSTRWCSAYLKIDVCSTAIRNQDRFNNIKTLVLSGERGEESAARAKYSMFEPDRADLRNGKKIKRFVDHFRPIRDWKENKVWEIIEKYKVRAHPAYYLGWGRVSCLFCIFGNKNQFCSACTVSSKQGKEIINYEKEFQCTIKRNTNLVDLIASGKNYEGLTDTNLLKISQSKDYNLDVIINNWVLPSGAYGESDGPT